MCDQFCYDLDNDPRHCGTCDRSCGDGGQCLGGDCLCADSTTDCGAYCADTSSDDHNCGGCGRHCYESEVCVNSECVCGAGFMLCEDDCTDVMTDPDDCGDCGHSCETGEVCELGECVCAPGMVPDGGRCVDPTSDPDACGPALVDCTGATPYCEAGVCAASCTGDDTQPCGYACVNLATDARHCGSCTEVCDADELCHGGCRRFNVAAGCDSCPCDACDDGDRCCEYPGSTLLICFEANDCPGT